MNLFAQTRRALIAVLFALPLAAGAQDHGTRDEAKSMVEAAIKHMKQAGAEQAFKDFGDKGNAAWHKKDLYVFVIRTDGKMAAHGANEKLVGKDQLGLMDPNGKPFVKEMFDKVKSPDGGWVEYDWTSPVTKKIEGKASYVKPVPGFDGFVGVGVYR